MASHGISRTTRATTAEQKAEEIEKIKKYRGLEDQVRLLVSQNPPYSPEAFQLTTRLLKLNPEYYTVWNVRRRLLISGSLSKRSDGSSRSTALPSTSPIATTTTSSAGLSSSSSGATPPNPAHRTAGRNGTSADVRDADPAGPGLTDAHGGASNRDPYPSTAAPEGSDHTAEQDTAAQETDLNILQTELAFTIPLLMQFPKCYWIWGHRRWLLLEVIKRLPVPVARRVWEEELGLVAKMLTRDRRNFHAWGYRRLVVRMLESPALHGTSMAEPEFQYTTGMIRVDLSNFSAWHGRSKLIPRLLDERNADDAARKAFFDDELRLIGDALNVGPEDQSLWYYHQFLMLNLAHADGKESFTPGLAQEERIAYVKQEIVNIKDLLEDYADVKWIHEVLVEYTVALARLQGRRTDDQETEDLGAWLAKLRTLDPMRNGRWDEWEKQLGLEQTA